MIVTASGGIVTDPAATAEAASKLREAVKVRDNHTCQKCGFSVAAEPHLLIEVDHKVPVSKGGLSVMENLQALLAL